MNAGIIASMRPPIQSKPPPGGRSEGSVRKPGVTVPVLRQLLQLEKERTDDRDSEAQQDAAGEAMEGGPEGGSGRVGELNRQALGHYLFFQPVGDVGERGKSFEFHQA